ncbi:MAG: hypothetical protein ACFFDT_38655 [Candidatus Hodarchaeota archaeon]
MCRTYPEFTPEAINHIMVAKATMGASGSNKGISPFGDGGRVRHVLPNSPKDKEAPAK